MNVLLLFLLTQCLGSVFAQNLSLFDWDTFKIQFQKEYTEEEEAMRRSIFDFNVHNIQRHNVLAKQGVHSHYLGVNQFSDLTGDEFRKYLNQVLMFINNHKKKPGGVYFEYGEEYEPSIPIKDLPQEVDWRTKGVVTAVRDQGSCGCCWAFSALGAIESAWAISKGQLLNLSVQNLLDCVDDDATFGCDGGNMESAFEYVAENNGIASEKNYPYVQKQHSRCYKKHLRSATISKFYDIQENDELAMMEALATRGPISAAINGDGYDFQHYQSGIYSRENCEHDVSHGVLLVGYGTSRDGQDYWIVRNSWGTDWGMDGYFLLARNLNMCGIAVTASFPVV